MAESFTRGDLVMLDPDTGQALMTEAEAEAAARRAAELQVQQPLPEIDRLKRGS